MFAAMAEVSSLVIVVFAVLAATVTGGTCPAGRHSCGDRCIANYFVCDGVTDCTDGSDESSCSSNCSPRSFRCAGDGKCIYFDFRCDAREQCDDGSDEKNCVGEIAASYVCKDNVSWVASAPCDGFVDCNGGEDEAGCTGCGNGAFHCGGKCIRPSRVCDGVKDCTAGEDEQGCNPDGPGSMSGPQMAALLRIGSRVVRGKDWKWGNQDGDPPGEGTVTGTINLNRWVGVKWDNGKIEDYRMGNDSYDLKLLLDDAASGDNATTKAPVPCPAGRHLCGDRCLASDFVCDGVTDCTDGSDESTCSSTCSPRSFRCVDNGKCIYFDFRCDGLYQCLDGSDENDCTGEIATPYACNDNAKWVASAPCDGFVDCNGGEDEVGCTGCGNGAFHCDGKCIRPSRVCDGFKDCTAGEDEQGCNPDGPGSMSGPQMAAVLRVGSRVVRGKDWKWGNQDGDPPGKGTITRTISRSGWATVKWDAGRKEDYRMGNAKSYELKLLVDEPPYAEKCGRASGGVTTFVVNGDLAPLGSYPWHAALYYKVAGKHLYVCGASLISATYVITAAHCVFKENTRLPAEQFSVALGKFFSGWDDDELEAVHKTDVERIVSYHHYLGLRRFHADDIALLQLVKPVAFRNYISTVCLDKSIKLQNDEVIQVVGWGNGSTALSQLESVGLPYISFDTCLDSVKNLHGLALSFVTRDKFCTPHKSDGPKPPGLARGDSGGGAVVKRGNAWFLVGIVSVAVDDGHVYAYTNVTQFYSWIMRTIAN